MIFFETPVAFFARLSRSRLWIACCFMLCHLMPQTASCQPWCRTQKNKATAKHLGDLKAKLCAARRDAWIANICKHHAQRSFEFHAIRVADVAQELLGPEKSGGGGKSKGFEAGILTSDGRPKIDANKFMANGPIIAIIAMYWLRCNGSVIPELL